MHQTNSLLNDRVIHLGMCRCAIAARRKTPTEAIDPIQRSGLVALCQGRIVEDGVDEVFDPPAKGHDRLADVYQFARAFAQYVNTQQFMCIKFKDQLEDTGAVADYLPTRDLTILRFADLVWNALFSQIFFVAPDS